MMHTDTFKYVKGKITGPKWSLAYVKPHNTKVRLNLITGLATPKMEF